MAMPLKHHTGCSHIPAYLGQVMGEVGILSLSHPQERVVARLEDESRTDPQEALLPVTCCGIIACEPWDR